MADAALVAGGPVTGKEFAALMAPFAPFEAQPSLAVAVSGGRDSLALAVLADDWARARGGAVRALIVDHGLRPEAAGEARATRERLAGLGIAAEILVWTGDKPAGGLQQAARAARYRLLREACRRDGILHLLVAHHAADQAETLAMRAARDSGPDGLAGMAALAEWRAVRLLRPLLAVPRERLTATLEARGIGWIDDPSNADRRFERVRVRQDGAGSATADRERPARDRELAEAALEIVSVEAGGWALDRDRLAAHRKEVTERLLARVVQAIAGRPYPPHRQRLARAAARLAEAPQPGKSGKGQDFTLSGCRFMLRREAASKRLRWIVRAETVTTCDQDGAQPLVPAAFFACDTSAATHLD